MNFRFLVIITSMIQTTMSFHQYILGRTKIVSLSQVSHHTTALRQSALKIFANKQAVKSVVRKSGKNLSQSANKDASLFNIFNIRPTNKLLSKAGVQTNTDRFVNTIKVAFGAPSSALKSNTKQLMLKNHERHVILFDAVRSVSIICALSSVGYYLAVKNEQRKALRTTAELQKQLEYKENMYFEAVSKLVTDLSSPGVTAGRRSTLTRQLGELDPRGDIRRFLLLSSSSKDDNTTMIIRPDLTEIRRKYIKEDTSSRGGVDKSDAGDKDDMSIGLFLPPSSLEVGSRTDPAGDGGATSPLSEEREGDDASEGTRSSGADDPAGDYLQQTLDTLRAALQRRMSREALDKLLEKLRASIIQVPAEARDNVISVVRGKIADTSYWTAYANSM